ncbi:MAG: sucrose phosphorylase [Anaerolineales bacterium]|nr:sucrose phosphorylase [Anaerolineales bacterium]
MNNKVQLITYPDSLGGNLAALDNLLGQHFRGVFQGGVHILPPFPSTGDRGFAPTTYRQIEPAFGSWADIQKISANCDVMLDIMVNHISRHSTYFQNFLKHGRNSTYADMFITLDKVWPDGNPPQEDVKKIFLRKPEHPFLDVKIQDTGQTERVWASFGRHVDYSEQIDLDVNSVTTRTFFKDLFQFLRDQNVKLVRLDAVGYVIKKPGTSCFMVEPEVYEFIDWLTEIATDLGLELLPEVHDHFTTQFKLAARGYWVYDFVLPLLILHTLETRNSQKLLEYLAQCPRRQITMLDCHDGIPVQPDLDDVLEIAALKHIVNICLERGANLNRIISETKYTNGFDAHQINITYYEALGKNDDAYLAARATQFFSPGIPQVYYVGLLAGENDQLGVTQTGEGRAINRHNFTEAEVVQALEKPVVQRLIELIKFRNQHPAFNGELTNLQQTEDGFNIKWQAGKQFCELQIDLKDYRTEISYTDESGHIQNYSV